MELLIGILGLLLSFFCSGAETAFISSSKIRFEIWLRHKVRAAQIAEKYFRYPEIYLSVTLVGNTIAAIVTTSYTTVFLIRYMDQGSAWLIITLTLLLWGEILPKVIFNVHANRLILNLIFPIRILHFLLHPIVLLAVRVSTFILNRLNLNRTKDKPLYDKKDIEGMLREAKVAGVVNENEHKIIKRILYLSEKLVKEAMVPRTAMIAVDISTRLDKLRSLMAKTGFTKLPVYRDSMDNIIGITSIYDLFFNQQSIESIVRPVMFTPENKKCDELLREFWQNKTTMAIVVDEYGGTAGLVTIQDLMEELFGEIEEHSAPGANWLRILNKNTFKIPGSATIEYINDMLQLNIPEGQYETIAGFVLSRLKRFPAVGEKIILDDYRIIIAKATRKKILEMRIIKNTNFSAR
jgi:CBS domain containing-hemolysin-like protein